LAKAWEKVAPVKIGGPATGMRGEEFTPGMYLKPGYVVTSRGCPNTCPHCRVWIREGTIRELPITPGWNVVDDNLLACSEEHLDRVLWMLVDQRRRPEFTGGLEAARLTPWIATRLRALRPKSLFFAYDDAGDLAPLEKAAGILADAGIKMNRHVARCYVLIGYKRDTQEKAEKRLRTAWDLGFLPMAMLYRGEDGRQDQRWRKLKTIWANPSRTRAVARAV